MALYNMDEAVFTIDDGWADQTVHILARPAPDGTKYGLVIGRDPAQGRTIEQFVKMHVKQQEQQLRGYRLLGEGPETIGTLPGYALRITSTHEGKVLFHYQAFALHYDVIITFTATSMAKLAKPCEQWMTEVLGTLKFRKR